MQEDLIKVLKSKNVDDRLIDLILRNGYFLQNFMSWEYKSVVNSVGDMMYGTKGHSSNFDIHKFISYAKGEYNFEKAPAYRTYKVKSRQEIDEILNDERRKKYLESGKMSFRGQVKEYYLNRELPNPFRSNKDGKEISILPGAYRNKDFQISFENRPSAIKFLASILEPNSSNSQFASQDAFRTEQHYSKQTEGLDISFDIDTALFFSNYKLKFDINGLAYHTKIEKGDHQGVIYCFVFNDPPVKQTEYLIKDFSFFKTYTPERILRQKCGLPFFSDFDRNLAVCDIDCIIYLDEEFEDEKLPKPEELFPDRNKDKFYDKLIELKHRMSKSNLVQDIVEYR
jgi:hypothetical protein